ncbi:MAG: hypothetical protein AB1502_19280 [Thermodesulfobacteriota bacterium]
MEYVPLLHRVEVGVDRQVGERMSAVNADAIFPAYLRFQGNRKV